jgi:hypothetical protein
MGSNPAPLGGKGRKNNQTFLGRYETIFYCKKTSKITGATTLSITTFSITTLSIITFSIMTLSIMTLNITTLSIMTFSIIVNQMRHSTKGHSA